MKVLAQGGFIAKLAQNLAEVEQAQALRHLAFHGANGGAIGRDADRFDAVAQHVLITDRTSGALKCCFRVQCFAGAEVIHSYSAQFYDLAPLSEFIGPMLELGRFCLHPECHDPDVLRLAWAFVARIVDAQNVALLFGCSSFKGTDPLAHAAALGALVAHTAPARWRPRRLADEVVNLAEHAGHHTPREALAATPALLRTYLAMGGWVSDHAVIDRQMNTLHVLTGVEIATIPKARARALRAIGDESMGYQNTAIATH